MWSLVPNKLNYFNKKNLSEDLEACSHVSKALNLGATCGSFLFCYSFANLKNGRVTKMDKYMQNKNADTLLSVLMVKTNKQCSLGNAVLRGVKRRVYKLFDLIHLMKFPLLRLTSGQ